mmetsp:Transcript_16415/g.18476  ORF Transcript_16415/g.18476 Transcript_16415/m.18476 type:complete len:116 (-) Transcript_16415:670-1017(-)
MKFLLWCDIWALSKRIKRKPSYRDMVFVWIFATSSTRFLTTKKSSIVDDSSIQDLMINLTQLGTNNGDDDDDDDISIKSFTDDDSDEELGSSKKSTHSKKKKKKKKKSILSHTDC